MIHIIVFISSIIIIITGGGGLRHGARTLAHGADQVRPADRQTAHKRHMGESQPDSLLPAVKPYAGQ